VGSGEGLPQNYYRHKRGGGRQEGRENASDTSANTLQTGIPKQ
jgi:hypothetical protein